MGGAAGAQVGSTAGRQIDDWIRGNREAERLRKADQRKCTENCLAAEKAPGKPTEKDRFKPKKKWDGKKVATPDGGAYGYPDANGNVWVPTGPDGSPAAHGGEHWDVQSPGGGYTNVYPGGIIRGGKAPLPVLP